MPLPVIVAVGVLATAGTGGVAAGADGVHKMRKAKSQQRRALEKRRRVAEEVQQAWVSTDARVNSYGKRQLQVQRDTIGDFARWLQENQRKVRALDGAVVDGVEVQPIDLPALQVQAFRAEELLGGGIGAAMAGFAARQGALTGVRLAATASTGSAISSLTGAAANSATLAWLGGGSLTSGGGGMAVGTSVLTGVGIAPALLISGLALNIQGHRCLTQAREAEAAAAIDIAKMRTDLILLDRLQRRIGEMEQVLHALDRRAKKGLAGLRAVDFDVDQHAVLFMRTAQLIQALREVLSTPVLAAEGALTEASRRMIVKYRNETNSAKSTTNL